MVPLLYLTIVWSLVGERLVGARPQQIVEITCIALIGTAGLLLATFVRNRNVRIERAYSEHLEELSERLRTMAYRDSLTDLYNHRYFYEQLDHEVDRSNRYGHPVSVILIDLDRFKEVNDTYGHLIGDRLLSFIGQVIGDQVRSADIAARYGGDEFAIILPETPLAEAELTAQKLAKAMAAGSSYTGSLSDHPPLSASYGVACCPLEARNVPDLLQLADQRLYAEKNARRRSREPQGQALAGA